MGECYLMGRGGGGVAYAVIHATFPLGSTVTCTSSDGSRVLTAKNGAGDSEWIFNVPKRDRWTIAAVNGSNKCTKVVIISGENQAKNVNLSFNPTPSFKFSGDYELVDDDNKAITDFANYTGNWKIRFLTSGLFAFTEHNGWDGVIDIFSVGGGSGSPFGTAFHGGGGAGGYTTTARGVSTEENDVIDVIVGAGGVAADKAWGEGGTGRSGRGGTSSFGNWAKAAGGKGGVDLTDGYDGLSGGTGGQQYGKSTKIPATDGADGDWVDKKKNPGKGQGTTTREFGESKGDPYSNGGCYGGEPRPNSGDAGRSSATLKKVGTNGADGIVIIRNHRS